MKHWLIKSEPNTFSWDDQVRNDVEMWDGVRNHVAKQHLQAMAVGDRAFFYHSVKEKRVVGVVEVVREAYQDPTVKPDAKYQAWVAVDFKTVGPMPTPVTLDEIKARKGLSKMVLVNNSRMSVQPVTAAEWRAVCKMGGWEA